MDTTLQMDQFSWRRIWMLFQFYYPTLKKQMILYPCFILVLYGIILIYTGLGFSQSNIMFFAGWIVSIMYYLAPLSIAHHDNRHLSALLPVKASEKMTFLLLYYWIYTYITTQILLLTLLYFTSLTGFIEAPYSWILKMNPMLSTFVTNPFIIMAEILMMLAIVTVTLTAVVKAKKNRQLSGIVYLLVSLGGLALLGGLHGLVYGIRMGIEAAKNGKAFDPDNVDAIVQDMSGLIYSSIYVSGALCAILLAILLTTLYKYLKKSGF